MDADLPLDLPRLRTLEAYLNGQLKTIREAIARLETQEAPADAEESWALQRMRSARDRPLYWLHRSTCHLAKGQRLTRAEAQAALHRPGVRTCDACRATDGLIAE
ncbi:DUF6233 domain-containing protein [Streptomyces stramineus]|uniref:DksA C4-type domain-containing protein n=1 Tax=Streptomyces stramineus TaxID=173861 RepID=A0ABP3JKU8_9ACTN